MTLTQNAKLFKLKDAQTAGTSAVESDVLDMSDYSRVVLFCSCGTSNAGNFLKAQQGAQSDLSDAADLESTKVTPASNGDVAILDLLHPQERYIRAVFVRGASTTTGEVYAIAYGGHSKPVSQTRSGYVAEAHATPDEGTA